MPVMVIGALAGAVSLLVIVVLSIVACIWYRRRSRRRTGPRPAPEIPRIQNPFEDDIGDGREAALSDSLRSDIDVSVFAAYSGSTASFLPGANDQQLRVGSEVSRFSDDTEEAHRSRGSLKRKFSAWVRRGLSTKKLA